jgi:hypothetical protein
MLQCLLIHLLQVLTRSLLLLFTWPVSLWRLWEWLLLSLSRNSDPSKSAAFSHQPKRNHTLKFNWQCIYHLIFPVSFPIA